MKRTLAKLLLDVAKYVATVVIVSTFFSKFAATPVYVLYVVAVLFTIALVWGGVVLNRLADEDEEKKKKQEEKNEESKTQKRKE